MWESGGQTGRFLLSCPHMARLLRIVAVNTPHHVTQRGNARQFILSGHAERLIETVTYNNRLQPTSLITYNPTANANILNLAYGYANSAGANNGDVTSFNSTASTRSSCAATPTIR